MMLTQPTFENELQKLIQNTDNQEYLLAISGGVDSVVLMHFFNEIKDFGYKFQVAHVNYKLRGKDSDLDQKIVEDFCRANDIKVHIYEVSDKDQKPENSIQLWAREIRYKFFKEIQEKENLPFLVTAHHLNDQLETFIINLSKAAGINGLCGIPSNDNHIIRPLLNFSKQEIYQFAKENNIEYREDLSNKKNDYLRNKIRNEIVPKIIETNDNFLDNFKKSISFLNQTKDFVNDKISEIEKEILTQVEEHIILDKEKLSTQNDFVQYEILKKYGFTNIEEIKKIFSAETGSIFYSKNFTLHINRNQLIFEKQKIHTEIVEEILINYNSENYPSIKEIDLAKYIDIIEEINKDFVWEFNVDKLALPLKLRHKIEGDVFYPIGFSGKKKVSKFFKDEKLSILAKQKIWLLCDAQDKILGIIPFRQDKKHAKDEKTPHVLKIFNRKKNEI